MIKINNKYKYKKVKIIKWVSYKQFHIPFIEIAKKINKYTVKEMIKWKVPCRFKKKISISN